MDLIEVVVLGMTMAILIAILIISATPFARKTVSQICEWSFPQNGFIIGNVRDEDIIGRTPAKLVGQFGTPYFDSRRDAGTGLGHRDSDDDCVLLFRDAGGKLFRIRVKNGRAVAVNRYFH